jgi:tetratricopeptide (TPR) repeat protein
MVVLLLLAGACGGRGGAATTPTGRGQVEALIAAADAAEARRDHDVARATYGRAVEMAVTNGDGPGEVLARRALADTLLSWRELPAARAQLEAITTRAPDDAAAWHDLGIVAYALGDEAAATAALTQARRLAPADPRPRIALASMKWRAGDRPGAIGEYQALLELALPARLREKVEWALRTLGAPPP